MIRAREGVSVQCTVQLPQDDAGDGADQRLCRVCVMTTGGQEEKLRPPLPSILPSGKRLEVLVHLWNAQLLACSDCGRPYP